jgi:predicted acylesterase/phospholipase RssA
MDCPILHSVKILKRTGKDLHINAVCINTGENVDFCNDHFPDMSVLTAIDASMSIPFILQPILYKDKLYIDGGTSNNLPLHMLPSLPGHKCLAVNLTIETRRTYTVFAR